MFASRSSGNGPNSQQRGSARKRHLFSTFPFPTLAIPCSRSHSAALPSVRQSGIAPWRPPRRRREVRPERGHIATGNRKQLSAFLQTASLVGRPRSSAAVGAVCGNKEVGAARVGLGKRSGECAVLCLEVFFVFFCRSFVSHRVTCGRGVWRMELSPRSEAEGEEGGRGGGGGSCGEQMAAGLAARGGCLRSGCPRRRCRGCRSMEVNSRVLPGVTALVRNQ